jgi:hypothetical protein
MDIVDVSGEVVWVDAFRSCRKRLAARIREDLDAWNLPNNTVPIRFWGYDAAKLPISIGFSTINGC